MLWNLSLFWRDEDYSEGNFRNWHFWQRVERLWSSFCIFVCDGDFGLWPVTFLVQSLSCGESQGETFLQTSSGRESHLVVFFHSLLPEAQRCVRMISKESSWRVPSTLASTCMRRPTADHLFWPGFPHCNMLTCLTCSKNLLETVRLKTVFRTKLKRTPSHTTQRHGRHIHTYAHTYTSCQFFFWDGLSVFPRTSPGSSRLLASSRSLLAQAARTDKPELRKWPEEAYNYQWGAMQVSWWEGQWGCGGKWIVFILGWFEKKTCLKCWTAAVFVFLNLRSGSILLLRRPEWPNIAGCKFNENRCVYWKLKLRTLALLCVA